MQSTDWPQICALYGVLLTLTPSPVVAVNRAVALAMRDGEEVGLAALEELAAEPKLADYHPYHLARAELLARLGRADAAASAYRQALKLVGTEPERAYLERRLGEISD